MAGVGDMRMTESGSKLSSERGREEQKYSHMACTSKREENLFCFV